MTDAEIIKALENNQFAYDEYMNYVFEQTLSLINRQKAEIERLDGEVEAMKKSMWPMIANVVEGQIADAMDFARAEAIKEYTELLKTKFDQYGAEHYYYSLVDDVAKEMGCDDNEQV